MATLNRNLKASRTLTNAKSFESLKQVPALIAPHGVAVTVRYLPQLLPMVFDASLPTDAWRPWQDGEQIDGFLLGTDGMSVTESGQLATYYDTEVIGLVMMAGTVPYDQIPLHVSGATDAALKTALRDGMRARGFHITNLDNVH